VVNQFMGRDPGNRLRALGGNPDEVREFAAGGGVVIDTRDLFALWNAIKAGKLSADEARAILTKTTGFYEFGRP
jgi:hypothetical protein